MERAAKAEQGKSKVTGPSEPEGWVGGRPTPPNFGRSRWNTFSIKIPWVTTYPHLRDFQTFRRPCKARD